MVQNVQKGDWRPPVHRCGKISLVFFLSLQESGVDISPRSNRAGGYADIWLQNTLACFRAAQRSSCSGTQSVKSWKVLLGMKYPAVVQSYSTSCLGNLAEGNVDLLENGIVSIPLHRDSFC